MLILIYDIVWWAIFLFTGFFGIAYLLVSLRSEEKPLEQDEFFGGVCIIVFVMMFLSIDKQSLI